MAATDEDFWGHEVHDAGEQLRQPPTLAEARRQSIQSKIMEQNNVDTSETKSLKNRPDSRKGSAKTLRSLKGAIIEPEATNVDAISIKHEDVADRKSIKDDIKSVKSFREDTKSIKGAREDTKSVKSVKIQDPKEEDQEREETDNQDTDSPRVPPMNQQVEQVDVHSEPEEQGRALSAVSDVEVGDRVDSIASMISEADNYYKDDKFEMDEPHVDSKKEDLNNFASDMSEVDLPANLEQQNESAVEQMPTGDEKKKKKVKKKKKEEKKKPEKGSFGILGMLHAPTVLAGAIAQAPPESLKKAKKKVSSGQNATSKSPIKKKDSTTTKSPRLTRNSRSRNSMDEITFLRKQLNETIKENRTLRQIQRRQDAALARLEGTNSDMPTIASRLNEEIRVLKEQLRMQKEKYRDREKILTERSVHMEKLRDKVRRMEKMLNEKGVDMSHLKDDKKTKELQETVADKEKRIKDLEHKADLQSKNFRHQFNIEVMRHKETQRKLNEISTEYQRTTGFTFRFSPALLGSNVSTQRPTNNPSSGTTFLKSPQQTQRSPNRTSTANNNDNLTTRTTKVLKKHRSESKHSKSKKENEKEKQPPSRRNSQRVSKEREPSPNLTSFAEYQRSMSTSPKKLDVDEPRRGGEQFSRPPNENGAGTESSASRSRIDSFPISKNVDSVVVQKQSIVSNVDDLLVDFNKRQFANTGSQRQLNSDDPFEGLKKSTGNATAASPAQELFRTNTIRRNMQSSADSGLASTEGSPPNFITKPDSDKYQQSSNTKKNLFDLDDADLFPLANAKGGGPKLTNGVFPWEKEAQMKTKS